MPFCFWTGVPVAWQVSSVPVALLIMCLARQSQRSRGSIVQRPSKTFPMSKVVICVLLLLLVLRYSSFLVTYQSRRIHRGTCQRLAKPSRCRQTAPEAPQRKAAVHHLLALSNSLVVHAEGRIAATATEKDLSRSHLDCRVID